MAKDNRTVELKATQPFPARTFQQSIQEFPPPENASGLSAMTSFTIQMASFTDTIPAWGMNNARIMTRDKHLRDFWKTESILSSAINSISSRNAAFEWEIVAENERLETALTDMFHLSKAQNVHGWIPFVSTYSQDLYTQDNGAFIEIIRDPTTGAGSRFKGPNAPVIGIGVLEASRCFRTGNPEFPIIYTDDDGKPHKMAWWSIIPTADMPSSMETMRGAGFCGVSRVLRMSQILREIAVYKNEKVSGRFVRQIHFVGGVSKREIEDVTGRQDEREDNRNVTRYATPVILASLDPEKPVSTATIELANLPDNFSMDEEMRWYIAGLALGLGVDYQDFAPLPGGNLGSSAQSEILHRKSRGKGPAMFMEYLQNAFRYYGVIPTTASFRFIEKDMAHERDEQELRTKQAEEIAIQLRSGQITPEVARDLLVRRGALTPEDIAKIDADYGLDILLGAGNNQMLGDVGGNTIGEDVRRTQKASPTVFSELEADLKESMKKLSVLRKSAEHDEEITRKIDDLTEKVKMASSEDIEHKVLLVAAIDERMKVISGQIETSATVQENKMRIMVKESEKRVTEKVKKIKPFTKISMTTPEDKSPEEVVITKRDEEGFMLEAEKKRGGKVVEKIKITGRDEDKRVSKMTTKKV